MSALGSLPFKIIDQGHLAELIEAIGIEDFFDIVKTLEHEVNQQIVALEERSRACQAEDVKKAAHRLAGLLSQFGAFEVAAYAEKVQLAPSNDELNRLAASMVDLCRASMAAIADLPLNPASP